MPGPHDMGGQPAGPMDFSEQIFGDFEQGADALIMLLAGGGRRVIRVDELRRAIESLPDYGSLSYYESGPKPSSSFSLRRASLASKSWSRNLPN